MGVSRISAARTIWEGFDFTYLLSIIQGVVPALMCITLHELSHGYTAYLLGDDTAKRCGRLTLNPIKHLDMIGLLMMLTCHVGWAKPVPVDMNRFKNPKRGMALTALAGPLSNFIIALVFLFLYGTAFLPLRSGGVGRYLLGMLSLTAQVSIGLGIFNLLPVPPLDGSKILFSVISDGAYNKLMRYERYGGIAMLALVMTGILGKPLAYLIATIYNAFFPVAQLGLDLMKLLFFR